MILAISLSLLLILCILVAVHFAEVLAHKFGQPYGSLVLAVAVTTIEVALIVSILLSRTPGSEAIVRDSIFATIMIVCNGLVGICLLIGALKYNETIFKVDGTNITLGLLITSSTLAFVLPSYDTSTPGPNYTPDQLFGVSIACIIIYATYVYAQMFRHKQMFLPPGIIQIALGQESNNRISTKKTILSFMALVIALVAVVLLSKNLAPYIEQAVRAVRAPQSLVGVIIAFIVLLPECFTAIRQALDNKMQISFNLALGSGLASIGLTIPIVAVISIASGITLMLGLDPKSLVFLLLTFIMSILTISTGKATFAQGMMHIIIFLAYIRFNITP